MVASRVAARILSGLVVFAVIVPFATAQQSSGGTGGGNTGGGSTGGGGGNTGGGNAGVSRGTVTANPNQTPTPSQRENQPIFLTGRVILDDGTIPPERVSIERVCSSSTYREGYTDSKGYFSIQVGSNQGVFADASLDTPPMFGGAIPGGLAAQTTAIQQSGGINTLLWGCELRASLAGYHSDSLQLTNRRAMDNPDIGTIVLTRMMKVDGYTTSATVALAPKEAKKSYEKGLNFVKRSKPDEAQAEFLHAVEVYPKHSAAWFELGKVYEQRNHLAEAREAYHKAVAADGNYVNPYERLYLLAMRDSQWKDAADLSEKVLRLNPYEFSGAYYVNAVANLQLHNWDAAEKSAREATKLRGVKAVPKSFYVLGLALANKGDLAASAESLRSFLKSDPELADKERTEKLLSQVEQENQARTQKGQQ